MEIRIKNSARIPGSITTCRPGKRTLLLYLDLQSGDQEKELCFYTWIYNLETRIKNSAPIPGSTTCRPKTDKELCSEPDYYNYLQVKKDLCRQLLIFI